MVNPGQFVKESVAMFNVQARDCEVVLKVVLDKLPDLDDDDGTLRQQKIGDVMSAL